jgi:hypothetical protein
MKRSLAVLTVIPLFLALTACSEVQEGAQNVASSAVSGVANAAADQVKGQICALVEDGLVSVQEKQVLTGLVSGAETAGVPSQITKPLKEIAAAGDQIPEGSVAELKKACEPV